MVPRDTTRQDGLKAVELALKVINQILTALSTIENSVPNAVLYGGNPNAG